MFKINLQEFIPLPVNLQSMRAFLKLNRSKLIFAFSFISILALGITLAILFVSGSFRNNSVSFNSLILIASAIFWPSMILSLAYISLIVRKSKRSKSFAVAPFNQLESLGAKPYELHLEDKWQFTEIIPSIEWKGFRILIDIESGINNNRIKLLVLVENNRMDETRFNELQTYFTNRQMAFDFGGIARFIRLNPAEIHTVEQLRTILDEIIDLLMKEHFTPASSRLL